MDELVAVEIFHGRDGVETFDCHSGIPHLGKALEYDRRNHRRGVHTLEPTEASVGIAAGEYLGDQLGIRHDGLE